MDFAKVSAEITAFEGPRDAEELLQADDADGGVPEGAAIWAAATLLETRACDESTAICGENPRSLDADQVASQGF
jgi:hypothetical protein